MGKAQETRFGEERVGLIFEFLERKQNYRGDSNKTKPLCVLKVTEETNCNIEINKEWTFNSWEDLKEICPTFKDILAMLFKLGQWNADWRHGNRALYAKEIYGHVGLYDDYQDDLNCDDIE